MSEASAEGVNAIKMALWVDKVLGMVQELVKSSPDPQTQSADYFRLDQEEIAPVLSIMAPDETYATAVEHLKEFRNALETYFIGPPVGPAERKERLSTIYRAGTALRNELKPAEPVEEEQPQTRLHDLAWRTRLDEEGHILFDAGGGLVVPIRDDISELARPQIIAQAIRQQPPYPEDVRPKNLRDVPGALVYIREAKRLIVFGDLHGRYDNLELALADKENWQALKSGDAHLMFLGDAVHPRSALGDQEAANADSFRVLLLILSLQAENPGRVHYLVGNHENAHVGGLGTGKGDKDLEEGFADFIRKKFNETVLETYEKFLDRAPIVAKIGMAGGSLLAMHASVSPMVRNEQGLINLTAKGRKGKALTDMLWSRHFDAPTITKCLHAVDAHLAIAGHTRPTKDAARKYGFTCMLDPAFGHCHGKQLILCSQNNTFGYLDIDLTQRVPSTVEDLKAPDGKYAFRVIRRRG
jgi:hypothetical protein